MIKWLIRRRLDAFEREYDYDLSYGRDILDASVRAALALSRVMSFSKYRQDAPLNACCAAGIAGTVAEDCGPCTQLAVTMAEREGVAPATIKAILAGDERAMPPDAALGFRFAHAVLRHDPAADTLREEIVAKWGKRALVSLAFAVTSARLFPTLKYALGYGRSCVKVRVAGSDTAVARHAA